MALINTTTTGIQGSTFVADGTGDLTIQQNGQTINRITAAPAFRASSTTTQSFSSATWTKCAFGVETFDTNNNYDSSTNYRFTPTVAGYYLFSCQLYFSGVAAQALCSIYKNGNPAQYGMWGYSTGDTTSSVVILIYANGTTDYFECWGYHNGSGSKNLYNDSSAIHSSWQGNWVRP
jgi:hypothetical protein